MSEEKKQRTDDESVELGSVLQLAPHTPTTKEDSVEKPADGKGFISLDEVYETRGFEALETLARNCHELDKNRRLSVSGFTVLKLDGCENFMPGFDRQNALQGSESFIDKLKAGFLVIIKGIKEIIIKVIDYIVTKIRVLLGFEKTERELAIVAEKTNDAKGSVAQVLRRITEKSGFDWEHTSFYEGLPANITSGEMFNIVHGKNRTLMEQVQKLADSKGLLGEASLVLASAGQSARRARSLYKEAVADLRAVADAGEIGPSDIARFRQRLEEEIVTTLDPKAMSATIDKLMSEIYNLDVKSIGGGDSVAKVINEYRKSIGESKAFVATPELTASIMKVKADIVNGMIKGTLGKYDPEEIKLLKDMISVEDAKVLENMSKIPNSGHLAMGYTEYANIIAQYVQHADLLSNILTQIKKTLARLTKWTNDVDRVLVGYVANDLKAVIEAQEEVLGSEKAEELLIKQSDEDKAKGKARQLKTVVDYDKLFISKHPYFAALMTVVRAEGGKLYKKYNGAFREVNKALSAIGVRTI